MPGLNDGAGLRLWEHAAPSRIGPLFEQVSTSWDGDALGAGVVGGGRLAGVMSVSQLHSSSRVVGLLEAAQVAVGGAARVPVGSVETGELAGSVQVVAELESQVTALRLALAAEADARRVAEDVEHGGAATGTDAWLAGLTGSTREDQARGLRLGRLLSEKYSATREAFAAGRLRADQVKVIVEAAEKAPERATPEQVAAAEEHLVAKATGDATRSGRPMNARRLRQAARRMFDPVDRALADEHEFALLRGEQAHARKETYLSLHDNGDGTWTGKFRIPELHGSLLSSVLDRLTTPRRLSRDQQGRRVVDETAPGPVSYLETKGAALCELIEHLPTDRLPAGNLSVLVTMDLAALVADLHAHGSAGLGVGRLDTGITVPAGEVRRLACDAGLVPAVLGGRSEPLDLGRSRRLHSLPQRRGLALVHDTCAVGGCERPFAWCEIHHQTPWSAGGATDLATGLPLCGHHHRKAHDPGWDLRKHPTGEHRFHRRR